MAVTLEVFFANNRGLALNASSWETFMGGKKFAPKKGLRGRFPKGRQSRRKAARAFRAG